MKKHAIKLVALAIVVPSLAFADGDASSNSQNNESNSYSSGSLSNYQINSNSEARHRVGSATCAAPSLDVGISGRSNDIDDTGMVYAAVNIPFGGSICEDAQQAELIGMQYDLQVQQEEHRKMNVLFQNKMAQVCVALEQTTYVADGNILAAECKDFRMKRHSH